MKSSVVIRARRVGILAAAAGAAGLVTACGSSASPGTAAGATATVTVTATPSQAASAPSTPAPTTAPAAAGPSTCPPSDLQASLGPSNGTAGTIYQVVVFTNTSGTACVMYGYPGVSFVTGAGGSIIGAPAGRNTILAKTLVTLQPGGQAYALVGVTDTGALPPSECKPGKADWLQIYPPGDTGTVFVQFTSSVCTSPSKQFMTVSAVAAGADQNGS
jgi:Protein of unknown function (DUF4232)